MNSPVFFQFELGRAQAQLASVFGTLPTLPPADLPSGRADACGSSACGRDAYYDFAESSVSASHPQCFVRRILKPEVTQATRGYKVEAFIFLSGFLVFLMAVSVSR